MDFHFSKKLWLLLLFLQSTQTQYVLVKYATQLTQYDETSFS